jgi:hypothetical protein
MKHRYYTIIILISTLLLGCATPYTSKGLIGGYSDTQLAPDVFRVYFSGNHHTSPERAQDFAMLRATDDCLQHGFKYFALIDENSTQSTSVVNLPGSAYTTGSAYAYGNTATYSGITHFSPGATMVRHKPHETLLIQCYQNKPGGLFTYDAEYLQNSIKQKYGIK